MDHEETMNLCKQAINEEELIEIRREFHRYPELSGQEHKTMERIVGYLKRWDIPCVSGVAKTGVVAHIKGKHSGKNIALRADIDALACSEADQELSYCSRNDGAMHACGHDVHTTILLGAAKAMRSLNGNFPGSFTLLFQPNEEKDGGAEPMIKAGCLESPHIDHVIGLHVEPAIEVGKIGVVYGKMYAASDMITLKVYGKSSHGAQPQKGVDAIVITANIINAIQTVVSRSTDPLDTVVCTIGSIHGGQMQNQVTDYVECHGIIRTLDPKTRLEARERIKQICSGVAQAMGGRAELEVQESFGPLITDRAVTDSVCAVAREQLGDDSIIMEPGPQLTAEDFSYFALERPSGFYHLGCTTPGKNEEAFPLHNSNFNVDERCIATGVRMQLALALRLAGQTE